MNRRRRAALLVTALVGAVLAAVGAAAAPVAAQVQPPATGTGKPDTGRLSPRLAGLSRAAAAGVAPQAEAAHPGAIQRSGDGRVLVDLRVADVGDALQGRLRSAGAEIRAVGDAANRTISVLVPDAGLRRLSEVEGVEYVEEAVAPVHRACNPIISEGDGQLQAGVARSDFGVDGSGVAVAVLSDSFDRHPAGAVTTAANDVAAGDLPGAGNPCGRTTPVANLDDTVSGTPEDEGRAMAQFVHDLAPGAAITFHTDGSTETAMANNITSLVNGGAKVIVDDVGFLAEPFYQDGPIAVAANNARAQGVVYASAAGNENITLGGADVGSYEAMTYRAAPCPTLPYSYLDCFDFDPGAGTDVTSGMTVAGGGYLTLDLQWAQPRGGVTTDLDLFVLDAATGSVLDSSVSSNNGTGTQKPYELVDYHNTSGASKAVNLVVARYAGAGPRFRFVHLDSDITGVEYSTPTSGDVFGPTIFGHAGAAGVLSVGAIRFSSTSSPEPFTSHGPVTLLFQPVPSTTPLGSPQVLAKPDIVATDCAQNSFFPPGSPSPHRFCGTSAAAPHAAAVAALLRQAKPSATPAEVADTLRSTAAAVDSWPATVVGGGMVDADAAVRALSPGTAPAITSPAGTTFTVGVAGSFTVTATGSPAPTLSMTGTLPGGVGFTPATGVLSGTPAAGTAGTYPLTFTASNGVSPNATQSFTLTVAAAGPDFNPLTPARILDTRTSIGGHAGKLAAGETATIVVTGVGGVPATGVDSVVLNVTATEATASTYLTVFPSGQARPNASNLNVVPNQDVPNLVVAKVGTNGSVAIYNNAGAVHAIFDVVGWYRPSPACFTSLTPSRILDTRFSTKLGPGESRDVQVVGVGGVPASGVGAVVMNVTATQGTASTWLTVYPSGQARPNASNLNVVPNQDVPNLVVAKVGANGSVTVYNNAGSIDVIFDVVGWHPANAACFTSLSPSRILDTRFSTPLAPGESRTVQVVGVGGVPASGVAAVVMNVTATEGTANTWITVYPAGAARPNASNLNAAPGQDIPNLVVAKVGANGSVSVYNNAGSVDVIFDVVGYYPG